MHFILKIPSLEHITLVKVAASLWNQHDIMTSVTVFLNSHAFPRLDANFFCGITNERTDYWRYIENRVIDKTLQLMVPKCLNEKICVYIQTIGLQILQWMSYHFIACDFGLNLMNAFYWTLQGTINKKKTAEGLIRDDSIDITTRYKLTCVYCLENDIPDLWNKVPESHKEFFYRKRDPDKILELELVSFLGFYIKGDTDWIGRIARNRMNHTCTSHEYAFESAANSGSKEATEYFLQKLNPRKESLLRAALNIVETRREFYPDIYNPPKEYYTEVLCFLLSQMSCEQQVELFKKHPIKVLTCFLDWPWQSFFLEMASSLWNFLPQSSYKTVFVMIIHKMGVGFKDYNYKILFRDVWQQIPDADKNYIINDNDSIAQLLDMLLQVQDKENIKLIFKDATLIEKNKLLYSKKGQSICEDMVLYDKWNLLRFFLQLFISSKDEMIKFKQEFKGHIERSEKRLHKDKFEEFSRISDDFIFECSRRKSVDQGDSSPV